MPREAWYKAIVLLGILGCIGMSLDLILAMFSALFFNHQVTLSFNKYHEHIPELIVCSIFLCFGLFSAMYLIRLWT